jgi:hypothetical protein
MCRHELPTDDPEYEEKRKERQAEQERKDQLRSSQRSSTPGPSASSSSPVTIDLTESQQAILDEVISISSNDSASMDIDEEYHSAEDEEEASSAPRINGRASTSRSSSQPNDQQSTAPSDLPSDPSIDLD